MEKETDERTIRDLSEKKEPNKRFLVSIGTAMIKVPITAPVAMNLYFLL